MQSNPTQPRGALAMPVYASIGIIAWNEADAISGLLKSLATQTIFNELSSRGLACEVLVVANGCTDGTRQAAEAASPAGNPLWKVVELRERGKLNAWNQFVHHLSSPKARFLFLMDADIEFGEKGTLGNMLTVLGENPRASISVDVPRKRFKGKVKAPIAALSNSATMLTAAAPAQLCAQLYCIRSEVARNIYLPRDLAACDDGFIKALVCTDSLTCPLDPDRIYVAPDASHTFEAYTSPAAVLRNQKRQVIGQTIVHVLIDKHLPGLTYHERARLGETLRKRDASEPGWLKRLIAEHVARVRFPWRLYPKLLTHRFGHLGRLSLGGKVACIPGLIAGTGVSLLASWLAYRALKNGCTDYWPKARRPVRRGPTSSFGNQNLNTNRI